MFEKEAEERTKQYMNEHTEKCNCENTKLETDNYNAGLEQGYKEHNLKCENCQFWEKNKKGKCASKVYCIVRDNVINCNYKLAYRQASVCDTSQ